MLVFRCFDLRIFRLCGPFKRLFWRFGDALALICCCVGVDSRSAVGRQSMRCWEALSWLFMRLGFGVAVRVFYGKKMGGKNMKPSCRDAAFLALIKQRPDVPISTPLVLPR
jgi:hypothetical protein